MKKQSSPTGTYYHVFNHAVGNETLCEDHRDFARLMFLFLYFQSPHRVTNISYHIDQYEKWNAFGLFKTTEEQIVADRSVEVISFTIMPEYFHILLKEREVDGVSRYMQRVQNAYTKFFNHKYDCSGHIFRGRFRRRSVAADDLANLSAYIHRRAHELKRWRTKEHFYPWSSYQDFVTSNRWDALLSPNIILKHFPSPEEYQNFVKNIRTKQLRTFEMK